MSDEIAPVTATPVTQTVPSVLSVILSGVENGLVTVVTAIFAIFAPKLIAVSEQGVKDIGHNFGIFLANIQNGMDWGEALANMMTADYREVEDDAKQVAIDFAESVAIALQNMGLIAPKKA